MHPQLRDLVAEFESASERLQTLHRRIGPAAWRKRPSPQHWSPGECVAHLNLTAKAMLPLLRDGIERARMLGGPAPSRYRRDVFGWMIWRSSGPSPRFKIKTTAPFVPTGDQLPEDLVAEFERLQGEQIACVRDSEGLPIQRVRIVSPFNQKIRYNVFSGLSICARHEHRHLQQAEDAARER